MELQKAFHREDYDMELKKAFHHEEEYDISEEKTKGVLHEKEYTSSTKRQTSFKKETLWTVKELIFNNISIASDTWRVQASIGNADGNPDNLADERQTNFDPRCYISGPDKRCLTCNRTQDDCAGHSVCIILPYPIVNAIFSWLLEIACNIFCSHCSASLVRTGTTTLHYEHLLGLHAWVPFLLPDQLRNDLDEILLYHYENNDTLLDGIETKHAELNNPILPEDEKKEQTEEDKAEEYKTKIPERIASVLPEIPPVLTIKEIVEARLAQSDPISNSSKPIPLDYYRYFAQKKPLVDVKNKLEYLLIKATESKRKKTRKINVELEKINNMNIIAISRHLDQVRQRLFTINRVASSCLVNVLHLKQQERLILYQLYKRLDRIKYKNFLSNPHHPEEIEDPANLIYATSYSSSSSSSSSNSLIPQPSPSSDIPSTPSTPLPSDFPLSFDAIEAEEEDLADVELAEDGEENEEKGKQGKTRKKKSPTGGGKPKRRKNTAALKREEKKKLEEEKEKNRLAEIEKRKRDNITPTTIAYQIALTNVRLAKLTAIEKNIRQQIAKRKTFQTEENRRASVKQSVRYAFDQKLGRETDKLRLPKRTMQLIAELCNRKHRAIYCSMLNGGCGAPMHSFKATGCRFSASSTSFIGPTSDCQYPVFDWELAKTKEEKAKMFKSQKRIHVVYDHMFNTPYCTDTINMADISTLKDTMSQTEPEDLLEVGFEPEGRHPADTIYGVVFVFNPANIPSLNLSANKLAFTDKQARDKIALKMGETCRIVKLMWDMIDNEETVTGKWKPLPVGWVTRIVNPTSDQRDLSSLGTRIQNSVAACETPLKYPVPVLHKGRGKSSVDTIPAGSIRFLQEMLPADRRLDGKGGALRSWGLGKRVDESMRFVVNINPNIAINDVIVGGRYLWTQFRRVPITPDNIEEMKKFLDTIYYKRQVLKEEKAKLEAEGRLDAVRSNPKCHPWLFFDDVYPKVFQLHRRFEMSDGQVVFQAVNLSVFNHPYSEYIKVGDEIERSLLEGDTIVANRQPTLTEKSIQAFNVRIAHPDLYEQLSPDGMIPSDYYTKNKPREEEITHEDRSEWDADHNSFDPNLMVLVINSALKGQYAFDQDGDVFSGITPYTTRSAINAALLMGAHQTNLSCQNAQNLQRPVQCIPYTWTMLTQANPKIEDKMWTQFLKIADATTNGTASKNWVRIEEKSKQLYGGTGKCGRALVSLIVPHGFTYQNKEVSINQGLIERGYLTETSLGSGDSTISKVISSSYGPRASVFWLVGSSRLAIWFLKNESFSLSLADLVLPHALRVKIKQELDIHREKEEKNAKDFIGSCEPKQAEQLFESDIMPGRRISEAKYLYEMEKIRFLLHYSEQRTKIVTDLIKEWLEKQRNDPSLHNVSLYKNPQTMVKMILCGSRGSAKDLVEMVGVLGLQLIDGDPISRTASNRNSIYKDWTELIENLGYVSGNILKGLSAADFAFVMMAGRNKLARSSTEISAVGRVHRTLNTLLSCFVARNSGVLADEGGRVLSMTGFLSNGKFEIPVTFLLDHEDDEAEEREKEEKKESIPPPPPPPLSKEKWSIDIKELTTYVQSDIAEYIKNPTNHVENILKENYLQLNHINQQWHKHQRNLTFGVLQSQAVRHIITTDKGKKKDVLSFRSVVNIAHEIERILQNRPSNWEETHPKSDLYPEDIVQLVDVLCYHIAQASDPLACFTSSLPCKENKLDLEQDEEMIQHTDQVLQWQIRSYLSVARVYKLYKLNREELIFICDRIKCVFDASRIQAGDAVGTLAASSIGEPFTQDGLNDKRFISTVRLVNAQGFKRTSNIMNNISNDSDLILVAKLRDKEDVISFTGHDTCHSKSSLEDIKKIFIAPKVDDVIRSLGVVTNYIASLRQWDSKSETLTLELADKDFATLDSRLTASKEALCIVVENEDRLKWLVLVRNKLPVWCAMEIWKQTLPGSSLIRYVSFIRIIECDPEAVKAICVKSVKKLKKVKSVEKEESKEEQRTEQKELEEKKDSLASERETAESDSATVVVENKGKKRRREEDKEEEEEEKQAIVAKKHKSSLKKDDENEPKQGKKRRRDFDHDENETEDYTLLESKSSAKKRKTVRFQDQKTEESEAEPIFSQASVDWDIESEEQNEEKKSSDKPKPKTRKNKEKEEEEDDEEEYEGERLDMKTEDGEIEEEIETVFDLVDTEILEAQEQQDEETEERQDDLLQRDLWEENMEEEVQASSVSGDYLDQEGESFIADGPELEEELIPEEKEDIGASSISIEEVLEAEETTRLERESALDEDSSSSSSLSSSSSAISLEHDQDDGKEEDDKTNDFYEQCRTRIAKASDSSDRQFKENQSYVEGWEQKGAKKKKTPLITYKKNEFILDILGKHLLRDLVADTGIKSVAYNSEDKTISFLIDPSSNTRAKITQLISRPDFVPGSSFYSDIPMGFWLNGIGASETTISYELYKSIAHLNTVNIRHLKIVARIMTMLGFISRLDHRGIESRSLDYIAAAGFERCSDVTFKSVTRTSLLRDEMSRIIAGKSPLVGTGFNTVELYD